MNVSKTGLLLVCGTLVLALILGYMSMMNKTPQNKFKNTEDNVLVSPPESNVDEETGAVSQESFEQDQKVSSDTSLDTIEAELNSTVILEEDFSDL